MIKTQIMNGLKTELEEVRKGIHSNRVFLSITQKEFRDMFLLYCDIELARKGKSKSYQIDSLNSNVINQVYHYLTGTQVVENDSMIQLFKGDLSKGLVIAGNIGTGKTMILRAVCRMIEELTEKKIYRLHSKRLDSIIKEKGRNFLDRRPLFIDDVGKESKKINDYGTVSTPVVDLFSERYENNAWTFATWNYSQDTLTKFYGETITDRFKEMFNVLILKGDSRRR